MDYWLSKLMYDLGNPAVLRQFREAPEAVIARYPLDPDVRRAALDGDLAFLQPRVNAYLLRFYFAYRGMSDADFIASVRNCKP
jgi:hypothetical protein